MSLVIHNECEKKKILWMVIYDQLVYSIVGTIVEAQTDADMHVIYKRQFQWFGMHINQALHLIFICTSHLIVVFIQKFFGTECKGRKLNLPIIENIMD